MPQRIPHSQPQFSTFYHKVMTFPAKNNIAKPAKLKPKPKYKTKAKVEKNVENLKELIRVGLTAGVGDDSHNQREAFYKLHLKNLNRDQLCRLKKKIEKIAQNLIAEEDDERQFHELELLVKDTIDPLISTSLEYIHDLIVRIHERLKEFSQLELESDNQNHYIIRFSDRRMLLIPFAREFFSDIIEEYKSLVARGLIIPGQKENRGSTFVSHVIVEFLHESLVE